jgi:type II secretory ATPase GspE/PulE/Tfp pilus assembly ATPase PilB-like protein
MTPLLAQAVSNAFLVDPVKPVLALAVAAAGCALTSRLAKDIKFCGLPSGPWHMKMILGTMVGLLAVLLVPTFYAGFPLQLALTATPFLLYWPKRNDAVPEKLRFVIGGEGIKAYFAERRKGRAFAGARLTFKDSEKKERSVPAKGDAALPVHQAAEALVLAAIDRGASRLDLIVKKEGAQAVVTVDGARTKIDVPAPDVAVAAINLLKEFCGLDAKEQRKRQNGACTAVLPESSVVLAVTTSGGSTGVQMRIDFDVAKRMGKPLDQLGLLPAQMKLVEAMLAPEDRGGVVLVAAAPGQGLTSTALALLTRHDAFTNAVKALERTLVHRVEGVDHQLWTPGGGVDYRTQLQSIVRRSPDVVLVDDISEPGTGKVIAAPTSSDIRFYVCIAVDGVGAAVTEWFRAVGDVPMAATPLRAVVTQRLVRRLCMACRTPFQPSPEQAKRLGIAAGKPAELFRAGGKVQVKSKVQDCPMCRGTGFSGQIGVLEVLPIDQEARNHLAKGDLKSAYNAARLKHRAPGMQEAALLRVREGVTSLEEVARVFAPPAAKPATAGTAPAAGAAKPSQPPKKA